jgi:excisionase family DNA binding protein
MRSGLTPKRRPPAITTAPPSRVSRCPNERAGTSSWRLYAWEPAHVWSSKRQGRRRACVRRIEEVAGSSRAISSLSLPANSVRSVAPLPAAERTATQATQRRRRDHGPAARSAGDHGQDIAGDPSRRVGISPALDGPLLRPDLAAALLAAKTSWVYDAVRTGKLPCISVGRRIRFRRAMLGGVAWQALVRRSGIAAPMPRQSTPRRALPTSSFPSRSPSRTEGSHRLSLRSRRCSRSLLLGAFCSRIPSVPGRLH